MHPRRDLLLAMQASGAWLDTAKGSNTKRYSTLSLEIGKRIRVFCLVRCLPTGPRLDSWVEPELNCSPSLVCRSLVSHIACLARSARFASECPSMCGLAASHLNRPQPACFFATTKLLVFSIRVCIAEVEVCFSRNPTLSLDIAPTVSNRRIPLAAARGAQLRCWS